MSRPRYSRPKRTLTPRTAKPLSGRTSFASFAVPLRESGSCAMFRVKGPPASFWGKDSSQTPCTRAGTQFRAEFRDEARGEPRQQVQHHHRRILDVDLEEIALHEFDAIGDRFALCPDPRHLDQLGLQLDADAARAEALRGGDHQAPVPRAEVVDDVIAADVGEFQHLVDDHPGRGNVRARDVVFLLRALRRGRLRRTERQGERNATDPRIHPSPSLSSRPCSAAITDCRRTLSRPPEKRRVTLSGTPPLRDHAKHTMPTGFSFVPPVGPATPVTATATCARLRASAPDAISFAVSRLTAPCRERVLACTPSSSFFDSSE